MAPGIIKQLAGTSPGAPSPSKMNAFATFVIDASPRGSDLCLQLFAVVHDRVEGIELEADLRLSDESGNQDVHVWRNMDGRPAFEIDVT